MKKTNKSIPPNVLTTYANNNPNGSWEDFRDCDQGNKYNSIRDIIFSDQGNLCAYCEVSMTQEIKSRKRVEHFHSKSDRSDCSINWALHWNNVIGVCIGGSNQTKENRNKYPTPRNLSCDSFKQHLESKSKINRNIEGMVLDPLDMSASPSLFTFDKATGSLLPNDSACLEYQPQYNQFPSVRELVEKTIEVFNLNCDRLIKQRLVVFFHYEQKIKLARKRGNVKIHSHLAISWFGEKWPSFFTTRRIILGRHAEQYLATLNYDG